MTLTATIESPHYQIDASSFHITLRVTNKTGRRIAILNPDMGIPAPDMNWPWSKETYQTSLLISFGYLSISVTDETGQDLPQQIIEAWATPVLQPKLELAPGDSLELTIPLGNFYNLSAGRVYWLALEYGDKSLRVSARARLTLRS